MKQLLFILIAAYFCPSYGQEHVVPNDPLFKYQVSYHNTRDSVLLKQFSFKSSPRDVKILPSIDLDITRAWSITTGKKSVVVAILDDGFFYNHEDVKDNIWQNPGENGLDANGNPKATNGIDDDKNGFVDDVIGWDFVFGDPDPDPYVYDGMDRSRIQPYWHSISALGIIGAKGNNGVGIAGINWDVSMMLLKIGAQGIKRNEMDSMRINRAILAIRYAADNGAKVINWSQFVEDKDPGKLAELKAAIDYAGKKGTLLVVAAGNDGKDNDDPSTQLYPQCFEADNLISVAEVDFSGALVTYFAGDQKRGSSWGAHKVHVGAIGQNFTTGLKDNVSVYDLTRGTSNAAPVVSGVAALILSVRPDLSPRQIKDIIIKSATPVNALQGKILSGGVIDAYKAVTMAQAYK